MKNVKSLRISIVQYLNTAPLVQGFTQGPFRGKYELSFTVPSQCAEALRSGAVDVAIIPAIEYQRIDDLVVLPNLSISSKQSVRSLLLISKKPVSEVSRIALDRSSRSTQILVRILCRKRWGIGPEFFEADPDLPAMLAIADAALLIGDPALRLALRAEAGSQLRAGGERICSGATLGLQESSPVFVYDVVEQWRAMTGLPAVLAVWAARRDIITPEVVRDFQQSLAYGMQHFNEISIEASRELGLVASALRQYLIENIDYTLDEENLEGLRLYFQLAAELGLIARMKEIDMVRDQPTLAQQQELAAVRRQ